MRKTILAALAGLGGLAAALTPALAKPTGTLHSRVWASGKSLSHTTTAGKAALSGPDDLVRLGSHVYVAFQNGVGSKGEASPTGNKSSTIVAFTPAGKPVGQWDVIGKVDGMGADPALHAVLASVNEDGNSSLYELTAAGKLSHFSYSPATLPSGGGTDAITVLDGHILISASAPSTKSGASVYEATLAAKTHTAKLKRVFADNAKATVANAKHHGRKVSLALTDPDSNGLVPSSASRFGGDFMLNSQGDQQLIFVSGASSKPVLSVLNLSQSVDDIAWSTSGRGTILTTDASADTIDAITGSFTKGAAYTAVTPCNANSAPATCTTANYLGVIAPRTGVVGKVAVGGIPTQPKGMLYVP